MTASIGFDIYAKDRASGTFKKVGNSADTTAHKMQKLGRGVKVAGAAMAAGLGLAAVGAYKLTKAAAEDQKAAVRLSVALRNNAHASKAQVAATEKWITAQGKALGVTDDELRPSLGRLVTATHDVGKAQRLASLAMNVSAGTGKSLEAVSTALMKAQNGQVGGLARLGVQTKDAHGKTLKFEQIQKNLAKTFRGQAATAADTTAGRFGRLKLILSETGESIGAKLLPPATRFAGWMLREGVPALTKFGGWLNANVVPALQRTGAAIQTHVLPAARAFADWFGNKIAPVIADVAGTRLRQLQAGFAAVRGTLQSNAPQLRTFAGWLKKGAEVAAKVLGPALKFLGGVQIKIVVFQIQNLIRGLGWFVRGAQAAGRGAQAVGRFIRDMAGKVSNGAQAFGQLATAAGVKIAALLAKVRAIPGRITGAIGNLNSLLLGAGKAVIQGLIDGIWNKVEDLKGVLRKVTKIIPDWKGPLDKDRVLLQPAGVAIMEGLIHGIESRKVKLATVLAKVTAYVQSKGEKLRGLLGARNEFASGFQGMSTSVFGADLGQDAAGNDVAPTAAGLIGFQRSQLAQALQVQSDVKTLVGRGLSKSLIQQLQSQGSSGIAQLHALASGTQADVNMANSLDKQTSAALGGAGMTAANALYGDDIREARKEKRQAEALAKAIDRQLAKGVRKHMESYEFTLHGNVLVATLKKVKRDRGNKPLGLD